MKTIGLLGGMSWESTQTYYRLINEGVKARLGGLHSAEMVLYSVDFSPIEKLQAEGAWGEAGRILAEAARRVESAGAGFLLLATNTMHRVAPAIEEAISIPLLHIADATGAAVRRAGLETMGLLGTRYTMEEAFYRGRLEERYGLRILVPGEEERALVNSVIYEELCLGRVREASRTAFSSIALGLAERGAQGVILGCTEIGLLLDDGRAVPLFDTTAIHAERAVEIALESPPDD